MRAAAVRTHVSKAHARATDDEYVWELFLIRTERRMRMMMMMSLLHDGMRLQTHLQTSPGTVEREDAHVSRIDTGSNEGIDVLVSHLSNLMIALFFFFETVDRTRR